MTTVTSDSTSLSGNSPSPHSVPLPESPPPSYNRVRRAAERASSSSRRTGVKWIAIRIGDEASLSSEVPPPTSPSELGESVRALPRLQEFYETLHECDTVHANLQACAKGIAKGTEQLYALQQKLCNIHEYWMEAGMNGIAHDLIPVLDAAKAKLPQSTFPPSA